MCSRYDNHSRFNSRHDQGDMYHHLTSKRIFTLIMNKIVIGALELMRQMLWGRFGYVNHLAYIACFVFSKKWEQREKTFKTYVHPIALFTHVEYWTFLPSSTILKVALCVRKQKSYGDSWTF